ncbi:MAG: 6-phosphogluconolactonase, partial [Mucilaginibacter sp.]
MSLNIYNTADEVLTALAEYFVIIGSEAIGKNGKFSVALSGGSSPKKLYELLASNYHDQLDWEKVYFFFGDERNVPQDSPDSNY